MEVSVIQLSNCNVFVAISASCACVSVDYNESGHETAAAGYTDRYRRRIHPLLVRLYHLCLHLTVPIELNLLIIMYCNKICSFKCLYNVLLMI